MLLDRADRNALVWNVVMLTPRGQMPHEAAIGMCSVHARVPSNFFEEHRVDVIAGREQFVEPALEAKEAHAATLESLGLEVLGATGDGAVQVMQCPPGVSAQIKGQDRRVHRLLLQFGGDE